MRSISCMVCALKYDSPQWAHDHIGMPSMTKSAFPRPKVRVTLRWCTPVRPHETQCSLDEIHRDDDEGSVVAELDDRLGFNAVDRMATDDRLNFTGVRLALSFDDLAGEEDVFEVKDREIVIFELFGGVNGHGVVQGSH